jgi:hypothetical protein
MTDRSNVAPEQSSQARGPVSRQGEPWLFRAVHDETYVVFDSAARFWRVGATWTLVAVRWHERAGGRR